MTDAIAGLSGGTVIKYIDTTTKVDVSGYGNILGAMYNGIPYYEYRYPLVLCAFWGTMEFRVANNGGNITEESVNIRVFYF